MGDLRSGSFNKTRFLDPLLRPRSEKGVLEGGFTPNRGGVLKRVLKGVSLNEPDPSGTLQRQDSKMSISQISMGTPCIPPRPSDIEVPELSYGVNPRMPSVSIGIDLRFAPERGRFFVATQDLLPGNLSSCNLSAFFIESNLL